MNRKHLWHVILLFALLLCLLPTVAAASEPDYRQADEVLTSLYAMLDADSALISDAARADAVEHYLSGCPDIAAGTVIRHGDELTWQMPNGVACRFSPELYALMQAHSEGTPLPDIPEKQTVPATKASAGTARDICLFGPYYGSDEDFEGEGGTYDIWGRVLARFTGGSFTIFGRADSTIDAIADALESCAVVLLDSHGQTNSDGTNSYICLNTGEGITPNDYAFDARANVYHACYGGRSADGSVFYHVDGTAIANHMEHDAPDNLLWNGTCFGMSTDGISTPLLGKGVGAVYGYSRDVSFGADRCWMETAMDELTNGRTLAEAVATTKNNWGCWDCSYAICRYNNWGISFVCSTASKARERLLAFPVVASKADPFPSDPNQLQTVASDWRLPRLALQVKLMLPDGVKCTNIEGFVFYHGQLPTPVGKPRDESHTYRFEGWSKWPVTATHQVPSGLLAPGTTFSFGYDAPDGELDFGRASVTLYGVYSYPSENGLLYSSMIPDGPYDPYDPSALFSDMPYGTWYYGNVRYGLAEGLVNGYTDGTFRPAAVIRRSELVSILYRVAGAPEITEPVTFSDVPEGAWYSSAVSWAAHNGIVQGYTDGTFRPNQPVTRAQLAVLLYRFAKEQTLTDAAVTFPDATQTPGWASNAIGWAVEQGLIHGNRIDGIDYLQPLSPTTRAQFVTVMQRYLTRD